MIYACDVTYFRHDLMQWRLYRPRINCAFIALINNISYLAFISSIDTVSRAYRPPPLTVYKCFSFQFCTSTLPTQIIIDACITASVHAGCGQLTSPKNGRLDLMIGLETDSEKEPEKAFFSCDPGYHLIGPTTITCRDSSWEGKEPVCQRKPNHPGSCFKISIQPCKLYVLTERVVVLFN